MNEQAPLASLPMADSYIDYEPNYKLFTIGQRQQLANSNQETLQKPTIKWKSLLRCEVFAVTDCVAAKTNSGSANCFLRSSIGNFASTVASS